MTNPEFRTLAYTKSPKTAKRTTFQEELKAAVSARSSKTNTLRFSSYSDDFNDDEDDFLNQLLRSRKKKSDAFKSGKSKTKFNNFDLSDDDDKSTRTKRVSFLKTTRSISPESEPHQRDPAETSGDRHSSNSSSSQPSGRVSETRLDDRSGESVDVNGAGDTWSRSLSNQTSDDTLLDLPLPSEGSTQSPGLFVPDSREEEEQEEEEQEEERRDEGNEERSQTPVSAADLKLVSSTESAPEPEPPRPKPRQRTLGLKLQAAEKIPEDAGSQDTSRPQTSSASIPLPSDTSSSQTKDSSPDTVAARSGSSNWTDSDRADSRALSKSTTNRSERFTTDGFTTDDSREQSRKYSTSFEEFDGSGDQTEHLVPGVHSQSFDSRTTSSQSKASRRPQSAASAKVESKYLGTLKLLDSKVTQESQPQAADSLRAAVYQEWLRKKKEKLRGDVELRRKEDTVKQQRKKEEEAKKEDAVVSYEAWKEKKAESFKAKAQEKQSMIRKQQREIEDREEKKQSAQQVFEQWKREHDHLLREKQRKQRKAEEKLKTKKQKEAEERQKDCKSAFSDWCGQKKDVLQTKVMTERKDTKTKEEEDQYMKEERDRMALEMYEKWLVRKDLEQKRRREERRIQAILQESPPPPWSPPNKTVPFGK